MPDRQAREAKEMLRRLEVRKKLRNIQPPPSPRSGPSISTVPEPQFGLPMPKRKTVAVSQASSATSTRTPALPDSSDTAGPSSQLVGRSPTRGATRADAITIDEDEDELRDSQPPPAAGISGTAPSALLGTGLKCGFCNLPEHTTEPCPIASASAADVARYETFSIHPS